MPPKVKMLPVNEIAKLIREHNKLSKIEMPKGKDRTRPNLIKAIEDAGYTLNHEKKRIEKGAEKGSRVKTDPKKDATKDPKKITMSIKPPMASMKIKPKASKPKNMKQLRDQVKDILKPVPARVKQFKKEGASLTSFKQIQALKKKYMKPYRDAFDILTDKIEEDDWFSDDKFDEIDKFFDDILNKGFDNAGEELLSNIVEVKIKDRATKKLVRLNSMEELKKYWRDWKDKYMNEGSSSGVSGSLREKYADWIAETEKTSMKEMEMQLKGKGVSVDKPKLPPRPSLNKPKLELKKPVPKKVEIDKDKKPPLNTMKIKPKPKKSNVQNIIIKECSKYGDLKEVDLNKIKYKGTKSSGEFELTYNSIPLTEIKYINEGSYGKVYSYGKGDIQIAVKTYNDDNDEEIDILKMLNSKKIPCNIINTRLIPLPDGKHISIMDIMSGDLNKLRRKLKLDELFNIVKKIAIDLNCLNKHKLAYTDLKLANVLFKCYDKKYVSAVLGDLGSICKTGSEGVATHPPFEYKDNDGIVKCNEKTMVWVLGVLILEYFEDARRYFWTSIRFEKDNTIAQHVKDISKNKKLYDFKLKNNMNAGLLLERMLNVDPKKRINLESIIKIL